MPHALTQRGLLSRDSESLGGGFRGAAVTVGVTFGARSLSHELENAGKDGRNTRNPLPVGENEETLRALALRVLR